MHDIKERIFFYTLQDKFNLKWKEKKKQFYWVEIKLLKCCEESSIQFFDINVKKGLRNLIIKIKAIELNMFYFEDSNYKLKNHSFNKNLSIFFNLFTLNFLVLLLPLLLAKKKLFTSHNVFIIYKLRLRN